VEHGVTIIGWFNLATPCRITQSDVRAKRDRLLLHLVKDGKLQVNMDDEIIRETMLTRGGKWSTRA